MICPSCRAPNDDSAEVCFTCGRALSALTQGSVIANRYEIESVLGKGGMGWVYRAHDRLLEETVAIKVLRTEFANTTEMRERFKKEIKLARKVSHRNVCRIHDAGEDGGRRYISMEYVEGADVKQLTRDNGGFLEADEVFDVAIQAAEGLQAIHDAGIIHRDLKASNIMRDGKGHVRLMDFGIAKLEAMDHSSGGGGLTIAGMTMGTPEHMSPEQCMAEKTIDGRSDIYALGVVLYELFTGTVPFRGDSPVATLFKHLNEPVPFEGPAAARIPVAAAPILRKALAKNREARFATAASLADALRDARQKTREAVAAEAAPTSRIAAVPPDVVPGVPTPSPTPPDRRRATRLETPINFMLRRVGSTGAVLQEERTVAENIGRGGARVFTSITSIAPGDIVHLEQVDGPFKTRAEVRGIYFGKDKLRRLNLHFVDSPAPDYLVHVDETR